MKEHDESSEDLQEEIERAINNPEPEIEGEMSIVSNKALRDKIIREYMDVLKKSHPEINNQYIDKFIEEADKNAPIYEKSKAELDKSNESLSKALDCIARMGTTTVNGSGRHLGSIYDPKLTDEQNFIRMRDVTSYTGVKNDIIKNMTTVINYDFNNAIVDPEDMNAVINKYREIKDISEQGFTIQSEMQNAGYEVPEEDQKIYKDAKSICESLDSVKGMLRYYSNPNVCLFPAEYVMDIYTNTDISDIANKYTKMGVKELQGKGNIQASNFKQSNPLLNEYAGFAPSKKAFEDMVKMNNFAIEKGYMTKGSLINFKTLDSENKEISFDDFLEKAYKNEDVHFVPRTEQEKEAVRKYLDNPCRKEYAKEAQFNKVVKEKYTTFQPSIDAFKSTRALFTWNTSQFNAMTKALANFEKLTKEFKKMPNMGNKTNDLYREKIPPYFKAMKDLNDKIDNYLQVKEKEAQKKELNPRSLERVRYAKELKAKLNFEEFDRAMNPDKYVLRDQREIRQLNEVMNTRANGEPVKDPQLENQIKQELNNDAPVEENEVVQENANVKAVEEQVQENSMNK